MTTVGSGSYQYEVMETWAKLPAGWTFGPVSAVATDSQDRVYAFQRKDPPIIVFDREGNYLSSWGSSAITDPHGIAFGNVLMDVAFHDNAPPGLEVGKVIVSTPNGPGAPGMDRPKARTIFRDGNSNAYSSASSSTGCTSGSSAAPKCRTSGAGCRYPCSPGLWDVFL